MGRSEPTSVNEAHVRTASGRLAGARGRRVPPKSAGQLEDTYLRDRRELTPAQARRVRKARRRA